MPPMKIDAFDSATETFQNYSERLEQYFIANDVAEGKRAATLLACIGPKTYQLLRSLTAPDMPSTKTYAQLQTILNAHLSPQPLEIAERFRFHKRNQRDNESIQAYTVEIKRLSEHCNFGDHLDQSLRDRLVCGLRDTTIQKRLLQEENLTFKSAYDKAVALEMASRDANELHTSSTGASTSTHVHAVQSYKTPRKFPPCQSCGKTNHSRSDCYFREAECNTCHKSGHIQSVCRSSKTMGKPKPKPKPAFRPHNSQQKRHQPRKVHQLDEDTETLDFFSIHQCNGSPNKIWVHPFVNAKQIPMELDTGSSLSIMSMQDYCKMFNTKPTLQTSNTVLKTYTGEQVRPLGFAEVLVKIDKVEKKLPLCIVPKGSNPLFGRNWLQNFQLQWHELKQIQQAAIPVSTSQDSQTKLQELLTTHKEVFTEGMGKAKSHQARLTIQQQAQPKFLKARPVPYALTKKVEKELDKLESAGILTKTTHSEWATPIVPVLKRSGDVRICGDFKITINPVLEAEQYTLPRIEDLFAQLGAGEKFSKIDLRQAYLQLPLDESSRPLTTINTHKGLYVFNRLVFGITSSPAIWQRTIDQILQGAEGVQCNQDDMIITGENDKKHLENLEEVLKRLEENGLKANLDKCKFFQDEVVFCGFKINKHGLNKTQDKVDAIVNAPTPENKTQLRSFLGLLNYYHKFLKNIAHVAKPLHELLQNSTPFVWSTECSRAFQQAKDMIASEEVLIRYTPDLPLRLACDASPYGIGAVLSHITKDNEERPIAYASRTLTPAERNYSQIDKEALAIVWSVKKFYNYICGQHFTLITDHQPLKFIFGPNAGIPATSAARQQRYAAFLSGFNYTIEYRNSKSNANADTLSRLPLSVRSTDDSEMEEMYYNEILTGLPISASDINKASRTDAILSKVIHFTQHGWPQQVPDEMKPYMNRQDELSVHQGCLMWGSRAIVPKSLQPSVLQQLHEGHLGIVKMKNMARGYFWWPGLDKDIEQMAKGCTGCMYSQPDPQSSPLHPWTFPEKPWQRIHTDYAGPFMNRMFLIVIDAHTKWAEVIPTTSTTSSATMDILTTIFARFGLPTQLVSDNGPQFTSEEFKSFLRHNGIKHITSAPYHPSTNGIAERFVQVFKNAMKSAKSDEGSLHMKLSRFLLAYRNSAHATTGESPAKLLLGRNTRSRLDILKPCLSDRVFQKQSDQVRHHSQARPRTFDPGENVLIRDYRGSNTWVHGIIKSQTGPLSYTVETSPGVTWRRHADQMVHTNTPKPSDHPDPCLIQSTPPCPVAVPTVRTAPQQGCASQQPNMPTSADPSRPTPPLRRSNRVVKPPVKLNL